MTFRELRESRGYRRGDKLAADASLTPSAIYQLDSGKTPDPRYSTIEKLAEALGVTERVVMRAIRESVKAA